MTRHDQATRTSRRSTLLNLARRTFQRITRRHSARHRHEEHSHHRPPQPATTPATAITTIIATTSDATDAIRGGGPDDPDPEPHPARYTQRYRLSAATVTAAHDPANVNTFVREGRVSCGVFHGLDPDHLTRMVGSRLVSDPSRAHTFDIMSDASPGRLIRVEFIPI
ncbi:hypothetical protein Micbo1qcDRAFT_208933 [Microdochium bolleyi]|uniref:Uncharacterized protein n=1 Tax=Microdochium bolleyi TaxID=196109 RepID=A0A136INL9_9PEZI|nr:hypothetical protein Micbo1qcDRAFT_208933 [Microdochium bolleyi]